MAEQLELADAPVAPPSAPDPWPAMRAAHQGKPLARRIHVESDEQEWIMLDGELAPLYDGATMFLFAFGARPKLTPDEEAALIERFNRLWHEDLHRERRA